MHRKASVCGRFFMQLVQRLVEHVYVVIIKWRGYILQTIEGKIYLHELAEPISVGGQEEKARLVRRFSFVFMFKQHVAQALQSALLVFLADEKRDIVVGTTIRNHSYRDTFHRIQGPCLEAYIVPV